MLGVIIERLDQPGVVAGPRQQILEPPQRVPIARDQLEDLAGRPGAVVDVIEPLVIDDQQASQQAHAFLLGRGGVDLVPQRDRQPHEVALVLVDLDHGTQRDRVAWRHLEDLLVDVQGRRGVPELLAVDLGDPAQNVDLLGRVGRLGHLTLEDRDDEVEPLGLEQDALLDVPRARVFRIELLDLAPGCHRPLRIGQVLLADRRDLLEPRHERL